MHYIEELLKESATLHKHLCPRQVLRARMGTVEWLLPQIVGLDNEREVRIEGTVLCRPCAGQSYYQTSAVESISYSNIDFITTD